MTKRNLIDEALTRQHIILGEAMRKLEKIRNGVRAPDTGATWADVATNAALIDALGRAGLA